MDNQQNAAFRRKYRSRQVVTLLKTAVESLLTSKAANRRFTIMPVVLDVDLTLFDMTLKQKSVAYAYGQDSADISQLDSLLGERWDVHESKYITRIRFNLKNESLLVSMAAAICRQEIPDNNYREVLFSDINTAPKVPEEECIDDEQDDEYNFST